jgi:hypothetical protein
MTISACCKARVCVEGSYPTCYFVCCACSKPCEARFAGRGCLDDDEDDDESASGLSVR